MFLLIDNYDSFTYNLVQAFYALGQEPLVLTNDDPRILDLARDPDLRRTRNTDYRDLLTFREK